MTPSGWRHFYSTCTKAPSFRGGGVVRPAPPGGRAIRARWRLPPGTRGGDGATQKEETGAGGWLREGA